MHTNPKDVEQKISGRKIINGVNFQGELNNKKA
jgi:hypothetical protein